MDLVSTSNQRELTEYLGCNLVDIGAPEAMGGVSIIGTRLYWVLFPSPESPFLIQELWRHMVIFNY